MKPGEVGGSGGTRKNKPGEVGGSGDPTKYNEKDDNRLCKATRRLRLTK